MREINFMSLDSYEPLYLSLHLSEPQLFWFLNGIYCHPIVRALQIQGRPLQLYVTHSILYVIVKVTVSQTIWEHCYQKHWVYIRTLSLIQGYNVNYIIVILLKEANKRSVWWKSWGKHLGREELGDTAGRVTAPSELCSGICGLLPALEGDGAFH